MTGNQAGPGYRARQTTNNTRKRPAAAVPRQVRILDRTSPARGAVETFVHTCYARAYGADLRHYLPRLMALFDQDDRVVAALGFRRARDQSLFLEQYLDIPVEQALANKLGHGVNRYDLAEIGNLAADSAGGARWLITALTAYLKGAGYRWAVFTAVTALRNTFTRLGIHLCPLAAAECGRLPLSEQAAWGNYYHTQPEVVVADVDQAFAALSTHLNLGPSVHALRPLWARAFATGYAHCEDKALTAGR